MARVLSWRESPHDLVIVSLCRTDARPVRPPCPRTGGNQQRGILYAALDIATCLAEVFQKARQIDRWRGEPWLAAFDIAAPVVLLDLTGSFATRAGGSMGLMSGPRSVGRNWARGFYDAYPSIQGLYYPSSIHANAPAVVLNERADGVGVMPSQPSVHRALGDAAILTVLRNTAIKLGYVLG